MNRPVIPDNIPALFVKGTEIPEAPPEDPAFPFLDAILSAQPVNP